MEDIIGIIPLILATVSLVTTLFSLKARVKAEKSLVEALQVELQKEIVRKSQSESIVDLTAEGERIGDHDPVLVRAIYRDALKTVGSTAEAQSVLYKALNDLAEKDRNSIKGTLKTNTMAGRTRYIARLFRKALDSYAKP